MAATACQTRELYEMCRRAVELYMSMVLRGVMEMFQMSSCTETIGAPYKIYGFWDYKFGCRKRGYFRFLRLVIVSRNATNAQHVPIYHLSPKIRSVL